MFQAVLQRAQNAVDKTIDQAINRTVMLVPFIIAAAFGTAALAIRLNHEFGPEAGSLLMAALFAVIGLITMAVMQARPQPAATPDAEPEPVQPGQSSSEAGEAKGLGDTDREMLVAALTTVAPLALPEMLRLVVKNLPLLAVLGGAIFVATRPLDPSSQSAGDNAATGAA
ncbi:MAG: hypothetical protein ABL897_08040 [Hyphomicrobium sp.]